MICKKTYINLLHYIVVSPNNLDKAKENPNNYQPRNEKYEKVDSLNKILIKSTIYSSFILFQDSYQAILQNELYNQLKLHQLPFLHNQQYYLD